MAKKLFALMMVLIMTCSCFVFAEEAVLDGTSNEVQGDIMLISAAPVDTTAKVVLEATEPDEDGYFTMSVTAYNFEFIGMQAYITYNSEAVVPVNAETKKEADTFGDFAKVILTAEKDGEVINNVATLMKPELDKAAQKFNFAIFPDLATYPNTAVNENRRFVAQESGLNLLEFSFKKISDKDAEFKIYGNSRATEPNGVEIADVTSKDLTIKTILQLPSSLSTMVVPEMEFTLEVPTVKSDDSKDSEVPMEQRVKNRAKNVIFLQINNYGTVSDGTLKWVDRDNKAVKPYIKDDRTMVPLRFIAEELGATVGYDDQTRAITITLGDTVMELTVDEKAYTLNGVAYEMDCAAEITADRTFVPVRFVSEALGKSVEWLEAQRMVVVTTTTYPWDKENGVERNLLSEVMLMLTLRDYAYPNAQ